MALKRLQGGFERGLRGVGGSQKLSGCGGGEVASSRHRALDREGSSSDAKPLRGWPIVFSGVVVHSQADPS